jgi:hypothetical protein
MPEPSRPFRSKSLEIRKAGVVVGVTDRVYAVYGSAVLFEEVVVKGDLSGVLEYNGSSLQVIQVYATAPRVVDERGARGPILKGVTCAILGHS